MQEIEQIFHPYYKWECYKNGFYNSYTKVQYNSYISKVQYVFSSRDITEHYMNKVVTEWTYSCENFLTNKNMNRVAWLGQSACCIAYEIPNLATMKAWSTITKLNQSVSNRIAQIIIEKWIAEKKLKITSKGGNQNATSKAYQMKLHLN